MRRVLFVASAVGLFAALAAASASTAGAAVTVGSTFTPVVDFGGAGTFIQSSSPVGDSYAVPTNGVITRWSFEAASGTTPPLKLKVVRPAGGDDFTTIGDSQLETPIGGMLNTWPTRISVQAGDAIGETYTNTTFSYRNASGYNTEETGAPADPPPGTTVTYEPNTNLQIDVSAVLEPDADHDGFGDETQDLCPTDASTQGPCPAAPATGQRAAALGKCKKKFHKTHNKKRFKKCKKSANLLPV
jgi:hypothetical protein